MKTHKVEVQKIKLRSYNGLGGAYNHIVVKHAENNYITFGDNHTNSIEGFWSLLKRRIVGIHHFVSPEHLHRYCGEFRYRYNNRKISDCVRFQDAIGKVGNARITYKKRIAK